MKIKFFKGSSFKIFLIMVSSKRFTIKTVLDDGICLYKKASSKAEADGIFFNEIKSWKMIEDI